MIHETSNSRDLFSRMPEIIGRCYSAVIFFQSLCLRVGNDATGESLNDREGNFTESPGLPVFTGISEVSVEEIVSFHSGFYGEIVLGVGITSLEVVGFFEKSIDGLSGLNGVADAADFKVRVVEGRVGKKWPRGEGGDQFGEVEGHLSRIVGVGFFNAGHVGEAGPALEVAGVILGEAVEPATGDGGLDAGVEDGEEDGVVAAERVTDAADLLLVDLGKGLEEIDGTDMVPDPLHGVAVVFADLFELV